MRNRFCLALTSIEDRHLLLSQIAENLMLAALEAEHEGADIYTDPAVLLLGQQAQFYAPRRIQRDVLIHDCELNNAVEYPTMRGRH